MTPITNANIAWELLMDLEITSKVIAGTEQPTIISTEEYEPAGFFDNVVFTNGHIINPNGDMVPIYYGASNQFVHWAECSIKEIFSLLHFR